MSNFAQPELVISEAPRVNLCPLITRIAQTPEDLLAAYRLRYDVYISEQRKLYPEANATDQLLTDELDESSVTIVAVRGTRIVGTVRSNWLDTPEVRSRYSALASLPMSSQFEPRKINISSRLAVIGTERTGEVRSELFLANYASGIARGTKLSFIFCRPGLTRLFRQYGYREYAEPITDANVGLQHRMVLVMDDILSDVKSPFAAIAEQLNVKAQVRPALIKA